jgi:hypothetical protein
VSGGTAGNAPPRSTEGNARSSGVARFEKTAVIQSERKGPGRPKGSRNKPKGMVPQDLAEKVLATMSDQLDAAGLDYVKGVLKDGKPVSTKNELQTLIVLLSRNLWAALVDEMRPPEAPDNVDDAIEMVKETGTTEPNQVFRRDVTDRLKVLTSLLNLMHQIEKQEAEKADDGDNPLIKIWAARGMRDRVAVLIDGSPLPPPALPTGEPVNVTPAE